ncbi:MAG TPA: nucleotidyltransferase domain-containing protein [Opitutus sp.]|nr:nucleotidyltransferase domain-containing protein [Opitutus sp.]
MEPHHAASIRNLVNAFEQDPSVRALLLGGSIAHGLARPDSDIDVSIVVAPEELARRRREHRLHYNNRTLCTYDGYIDGKYVDLDFLRLVAARGSEPARFAYDGAQILFSREEALPGILAAIVRYPVEGKRERVERFGAQLLAWRWFYSEGVRHGNRYLVTLAISKLVLFACRVVLAENERLFPFHKWMLRVTAAAARQPAGFMAALDELLTAPPRERVDGFVRGVLAFAGIDFAQADAAWPTTFMTDTELKWMREEAGIDEI